MVGLDGDAGLGGASTDAAGDAVPAPCARPAWLSATRLVYPSRAAASNGPGTLKPVTVSKDGMKPGRALGRTTYFCAMAPSGDGRHLVGLDGQGGAGVFDVAARKDHKIPGIGSFRNPPYAADVRGVSRDGRYAVVSLSNDGNTPGDGSPVPFAEHPTLVDTRTGAHRRIGVQGRLLDARYLPGGALLVRVAGRPANTLVMLVGGKAVKRWTEPAKVRTWGLAVAGP
jgi:hypothetical protein